MRYHEVRNYGFNHIVRRYAGFPWYLPLPAHMEHGWTKFTKALKSDINTGKPLMLVFSERRAKAWKDQSDVPVAIMGSPFIHYKKLHNISRKANARGTVVFVSHSTYDIKCQFDQNDLCKRLKNLPKQYQPVTVCLAYLDFIDKTADVYKKMGFDVVSAGARFVNSMVFVENFYEILSSHEYAASNAIGSYTFYAVDFGLPFFLIGFKPKLINLGNRDINLLEAARHKETEFYKETYALFSTGPIETISKKQTRFVADEMGVGDCLSGKELGSLLNKYYKKNNYRMLIVSHLLSLALHAIIFNAPWTGWIISVRSRLGARG